MKEATPVKDTPQPQEHANPGTLPWEARNLIFPFFFFFLQKVWKTCHPFNLGETSAWEKNEVK